MQLPFRRVATIGTGNTEDVSVAAIPERGSGVTREWIAA
jgi:hypothetical protein